MEKPKELLSVEETQEFAKTLTDVQCGEHCFGGFIPAAFSPTGGDLHPGETWNFDKVSNKWVKATKQL